MYVRKISVGILTVCLALALLAPAVAAVEPSYKVSDDYKDTKYYNNLLAYELTGDQVTDVIAIALSQLGYHEGNKDAEKDGLNKNGSKNFVEYNVLFGKLDNGEGNGTSYGYAWCAAFVNWCLRQARVDGELTGGMYVSCASWRNWFLYEGKAHGASYHARTDSYTPVPGDLIFFKSLTATHSRPTDHIGIVLKCEGGTVYTIEGNGDNRVALHSYALSDAYIVGYGSIAYQTADVPAVDYYAEDHYLPGFYVSGTGVLSVYNAPASGSGKVTSLSVFSVHRVLCVQGQYGYVQLPDGTGGWVLLKRFTPMTTDVYHTVTLQNGEMHYEIQVAAGAAWTLPESALLGDALGDLAKLQGWRIEGGDGALLTAGQAITPDADLTLLAVTEQESQAETTDQAPTAENPSVEVPTTEDAVAPTPKEPGCGSLIGGGAVLLLLLGAVLVTGKKGQD